MTLYGWTKEYPCGRTKEFFEDKKQINPEEYLKVATYLRCRECGELVSGHPPGEENTNKRCCWFPRWGAGRVSAGK